MTHREAGAKQILQRLGWHGIRPNKPASDCTDEHHNADLSRERLPNEQLHRSCSDCPIAACRFNIE